VPTDNFPALAYEIPQPEIAEAAVADVIPGVIRPAAAPLPAQQVLRAGGPANNQDSNSSPEAN
jgi:hypothetical protein